MCFSPLQHLFGALCTYQTLLVVLTPLAGSGYVQAALFRKNNNRMTCASPKHGKSTTLNAGHARCGIQRSSPILVTERKEITCLIRYQQPISLCNSTINYKPRIHQNDILVNIEQFKTYFDSCGTLPDKCHVK